MNIETIVLIGIMASAALGVLSNWFYDLLKQKGFLPDNPSLKHLLIVVFVLLPGLIFFIALPEMQNLKSTEAIPENVIASERIIACMQQHGMKQADEIIIHKDDWNSEPIRSQTFAHCDWPPLSYSAPDGYYGVKVDTVPGPEYYMDLSNFEMIAPIAERIHSNCEILTVGFTFSNLGGGGPLKPIEIKRGGIYGSFGEEWNFSDEVKSYGIPGYLGFYPERDETVILHTFDFLLDFVDCVQ